MKKGSSNKVSYKGILNNFTCLNPLFSLADLLREETKSMKHSLCINVSKAHISMTATVLDAHESLQKAASCINYFKSAMLITRPSFVFQK